MHRGGGRAEIVSALPEGAAASTHPCHHDHHRAPPPRAAAAAESTTAIIAATDHSATPPGGHAFPAFRYIVFVLKRWLRLRGLHDTFRGGVGSFLLQLLVVSNLQHPPARRRRAPSQ